MRWIEGAERIKGVGRRWMHNSSERSLLTFYKIGPARSLIIRLPKVSVKIIIIIIIHDAAASRSCTFLSDNSITRANNFVTHVHQVGTTCS